MFTFEFTSKESGYKQNSVAYEKVVFASRLEKQAGAFFGPGCTQKCRDKSKVANSRGNLAGHNIKGCFSGFDPLPRHFLRQTSRQVRICPTKGIAWHFLQIKTRIS